MAIKKFDDTREQLPLELQSTIVIAASNLAVYLTNLAHPSSPKSAEELLIKNFDSMFSALIRKVEDFTDEY